jgi:[CysO sulfur-carrier protein]-S-L-cysteine hydrolase
MRMKLWPAKNRGRQRSNGAHEERLVEIPKQFADAMIEHALEEDPKECCGLLAGKDGRVEKHYRITNTEQSPYRYRMDDREFFSALMEVEDNGWEVLVFYHSHTHTEAYPSATDIRQVTWPDAYYLILSLLNKEDPVLRMFRIQDGHVTESPVTVV